ncbi:hypothetical protein DNH61_07775 [Paenibacillus sambharensis]|uniref:Phage tail tape measure protein domain-containing protein n=1 Tax=Paenibacillus sambharensis TaxID=1803190 RepID=A0A2W1LE88_9BACL|nr:phage tail tape measure protein [Paenibacillus sambharensis]PZD96400.1 hypothetical protein DNH61_07775 [Paenibacillus sambharensis]
MEGNPTSEAVKQFDQLLSQVGSLDKKAREAIVSIGKAGIKAASEFESAMRGIQAATGTTTDQMGEVREIAKGLYAGNLGESWADLGSVMATVKQGTDMAGDALAETTRNAILLRDQFKIGISDSISTSNEMMDQFGITSEESMNLLAQGVQHGLNQSGELFKTIRDYADPFQNLGFSAEEMFELLAAGSAGNAQKLKALGDAMKEFGARSMSGSTESVEAFQQLGFQADNMVSIFAGGGPKAKEAFDQVIQALSELEDPVTRNTVGTALMGEQFKVMQAETLAAFGAASQQFDSTKNSMDELNAMKFDSPSKLFAAFSRQLETDVLIPIGQQLLPYLMKFGQWLTSHGPQIAAFGNAVSEGLGKIAPVVEGTMNVVLSMASGILLWEGLAPLIIGLAAAFQTYKAVLFLTELRVNALAVAQRLYSVILTMSPFGLIVSAIVGLVAALITAYNTSETFRNAVLSVWEAIKNAFAATLDFFVITVPAVFNQIIGWLISFGLQIITTILEPWTALGSTLPAALAAITTVIASAWDVVWQNVADLGDGIKGIFTGVWDWVKDGFISAINWVIDKLNWFINKVNNELSFTLPDWMGGYSFQVNVPTISHIGGNSSGNPPGIPAGKIVSDPWAPPKLATTLKNGEKFDGSHKAGLNYVPFDGYIAELHRGERVLTAEENRSYTPEAAPARVSNGKQELAISIAFSGNGGTSGSGVGDQEEMRIRQIFNSVLESTLRKMNLEASH